jgi:four helix bundle protein
VRLSIALGSMAEVETFLDLSMRLKFGDPAAIHLLTEQIAEVLRMLRGLQRSLRARIQNSSLNPDL